IPLLVRHFVQQLSRRFGKAIDSIASDTMTALVKYQWPGNIRELQNVIERAVILTTGAVLRVQTEELRTSENLAVAAAASASPSLVTSPGRSMRSALDDAERQQILAALEKANWIVAGPNGAAALLGMKRSTLQSRMQKLGVRVSRTGA